MRLIGHLPTEANARTFGDYLYVQGIENQLEFTKDEGWAVWVNEEEKIPTATQLLAEFREKPDDPRYKTQAKDAEGLRAEKAKGEEAWRKRLHDRRHLFRPLTAYGFGVLSFGLIVISVVVAILSNLGYSPQKIQGLFITQYMISGDYVQWNTSLPEIRQGEVWRLITPIFIHFGPIHLLFNMMWLRDLGSMIEVRQSTWLLAAFVLIVAAGSNLAQFYVGHIPNFGGMSGVLYGLLGYIWIRGKLDPGSGLYLHSYTVTMMLIWLVVCLTGFVGPIANVAHVAGLVMGMAWGWLSSLRYR
jgi:GlpG protein